MKPYEKTLEDPAIPVIFALKSPPVQLSAVNNCAFFQSILPKVFWTIFGNLAFKISIQRLIKVLQKIPAKISSKITPKVLFILSILFIG